MKAIEIIFYDKENDAYGIFYMLIPPTTLFLWDNDFPSEWKCHSIREIDISKG